MKPKKIRVINGQQDTTNGDVYNVVSYAQGCVWVIDDTGQKQWLNDGEWEPVSEFNHGDPVWAWDDGQKSKHKGLYLCPTLSNEDHYVECKFGPDPYQNVEHRKTTMTLQELADKADVNLDEVEIVE